MPTSTHPNTPDVFPTFHIVGLARGTRGAETLTVAEHPFHRDLTVGVILSRTLWRQTAFREHVAQVRDSADPRSHAWDLSGRYARGKPRRGLIGNLLLTAALVPERFSAQMLEYIWMRPIVDREGSPLKGYHRVTPKTAVDAARGSELIARRGAGLCIVPECQQPRTTILVGLGGPRKASEAKNTGYCAKHHDDASRYADEKAIERTFEAAMKAWPCSEEREILCWWFMRRASAGLSPHESCSDVS